MAVSNITANTAGTQLRTGQGVLMAIIVGVPGIASTLTIYDGTSTAGTVLATINTALANGAAAMTQLGLTYTKGLFVATTGTTPANLTLVY